MSIIRIDTVFNIDLEFEAAPFQKRLLAYLIDLALLLFYMFTMQYAFDQDFGLGSIENEPMNILLIVLPMFVYSLVTEVAMNGQTIGKKMMKIRVISFDGGEPTLGQYIIRWISKFFEWPLLFGFLFLPTPLNSVVLYLFITGMLGIVVIIIIAVTKKNQRLGDIAAGTVLVKTKTDFTVNDTVFMNISNDNYKVMFPEVMRLSDNDINTIKSVLTQARKNDNLDVGRRVEYKIKDVLNIRSDLYTIDFLDKLLEDYNYLATKE